MENKKSPPFQGLTLHGTVVLTDDSIEPIAPTVLKNTKNDMAWNEDVRNHQLLKAITDILCL